MRRLREAILALDELLHKEGNRRAQMVNGGRENKFHHMGSTATVAIVHCDQGGRFVTVVNLGDSRALLCRGGRPIPLSNEHKPSHQHERRRIEGCGGTVVEYANGMSRVQVPNAPNEVGLAMSRVLGDFLFKGGTCLQPTEKQLVIAEPEVLTKRMESKDVLLLGSDGIFELHTDQEIVENLCQNLSDPKTGLLEALQPFLDWCCAETEGNWPAGFDNLSAVLLRFSDV